MFFSHVTNHQKGVCILINPSYSLCVDTCCNDPEGRIVAINLTIDNVNLSICNIYAPNDPLQQDKFVQNLNEIFLSKVDIDNAIIGGDWNVTLEHIDKKGGPQWRPSTYRNKLLLMMEDLNLSDVFRQRNPLKRSYTYESKYFKVKSRIDFFLVSNSISNHVLAIESKISIAPDHKAVLLKLQITNRDRGPGLSKFNSSLIEDENYVNLVKNSYSKFKENYVDISDQRLK